MVTTIKTIKVTMLVAVPVGVIAIILVAILAARLETTMVVTVGTRILIPPTGVRAVCWDNLMYYGLLTLIILSMNNGALSDLMWQFGRRIWEPARNGPHGHGPNGSPNGNPGGNQAGVSEPQVRCIVGYVVSWFT